MEAAHAPVHVPPQNLDAEQSVLGAMMVSEASHDQVFADVRLLEGDFYRQRNAVVFRAIKTLYERDEPVDAISVTEFLTQHGELDSAGGKAEVSDLASRVPAPGNARHYAQIVKQNSLLRRLLAAAQEIQQSVHTRENEPLDLVESAERLLFNVAHEERTSDFRTITEILEHEIERLEDLSKSGGELTGVASGFRRLDEITGGFQPGNLIVIAARPSMGKSSLVCNIAENVAVDAQNPVALFSLEMSETELAHRILASRARVSGDKLRKGQVTKDWPRIVRVANELENAPLWIDDSSDLGLLDLRAKARRLYAKEDGLGLIIVDYIQLMRTDDPRANRVEQVGQMSRGLKILARELDVPVIALSQLSRAPEQRPDKVPILSDLRESGCLTGDTLVFLPETGERRRIADLVGQSGFNVLAAHDDGQVIRPGRASRAFSTGTKPVFSLQTAIERRIRATANHRFLTTEGWKRLDQLGVGMKIAVPERVGEADAAAVRWDRVAQIEPAGVEEVFDMTVPGPHNFVADDIVVHNSIEQDADMVAFIFRDEYYTREESDRPGEADLIVAKHRNGPTGNVELAFLSTYPKFANLHKDKGAGQIDPRVGDEPELGMAEEA